MRSWGLDVCVKLSVRAFPCTLTCKAERLHPTRDIKKFNERPHAIVPLDLCDVFDSSHRTLEMVLIHILKREPLSKPYALPLFTLALVSTINIRDPTSVVGIIVLTLPGGHAAFGCRTGLSNDPPLPIALSLLL